MDFLTDFQTHQIVCLEHQQTRLYAEIIQVVKGRQTCWVRPLLLSMPLTTHITPAPQPEQESRLYDLRQGADLLWPIALFRAALDVEVLPLLAQLQEIQITDSPLSASVACHQLSQFIRQVWQAYPETF